MNKNIYALEYVQSHSEEFEGITPNTAYATYTSQAIADGVEAVYSNNFSFLVSCMGYENKKVKGVNIFTRKQIRKQTRAKGCFVPKPRC